MMRRKAMVERLMEAELLVGKVRAYMREHDHAVPDGVMLRYDYEAMVRAVSRWDGDPVVNFGPALPTGGKVPPGTPEVHVCTRADVFSPEAHGLG